MIELGNLKEEGQEACMEEKRNGCEILFGKPKGKRPLAIPGRRGR
jgi:hypothetical protein